MADKDEQLKGRTCVTCACSYLVEPPAVLTPQQLATNPELQNAKAVLICRLNPPTTVDTPQGPRVLQQPTMPYMSCWYWLEPGTLPGDARAISPSSKLKTSLDVSLDLVRKDMGKGDTGGA